MRIAVAVAAVAALSVNSAAAQERGWLAIGTDSASHAFSFRSADDAVTSCGFQDCEVVETFTACLAVAYSSETSSGASVWTWNEAAAEGDANRGARDECIEAGGLACAVMNAYCADGAIAAAPQAPPPATPEQETVFWQSIADSTNPAEFEAYLSQFPNGVFRALAEARLAALLVPADTRPNADEVFDFGDDAGEYARDGECDDPRFEGPGAVYSLDSHRGHDATDCRQLFDSGRISLRSPDVGTVAADATPDHPDDGLGVFASNGDHQQYGIAIRYPRPGESDGDVFARARTAALELCGAECRVSDRFQGCIAVAVDDVPPFFWGQGVPQETWGSMGWSSGNESQIPDIRADALEYCEFNRSNKVPDADGVNRHMIGPGCHLLDIQIIGGDTVDVACGMLDARRQ